MRSTHLAFRYRGSRSPRSSNPESSALPAAQYRSQLPLLDLSYEEARAKGLLGSRAELEEAIYHGAVKRVRPKMMTVAAAFMGLMPIMWSVGSGADVMKRVAAPMVGGLATSFLLELLVYPAIYLLWKSRAISPTATRA